MPPLVELESVTKVFRSDWTFSPFVALQDVSLEIQAGEVYGLIGHNGAGKTTAFKLLVGLIRPTRGRIRFDGCDLEHPRQRAGIGFSPEQPYFYDYLTVFEILDFYGRLYGMDHQPRRRRIDELLHKFHLEPKRHVRMRALSKGNLQRVAVAQAVLNRPRLAILDEPMSGLDPSGRKEMRDLIGELNREGTTVLFSSHVLSDAEAVCDRVAILSGGVLREIVNIGALDQAPSAYRLVAAGVSESLAARLAQLADAAAAPSGETCDLSFGDYDRLTRAIDLIQAGNARIESVQAVRPTLEERFLHYANPADPRAN